MTLTLTETEAPPILEVHQRAEASEAEALMEETTPATALAQVRVAEAQAVEEVQTEKELQLAAAEDQPAAEDQAVEDQVATQVQTEEELQVVKTAAAADGQMEIRLELLFNRFSFSPCLTFSLHRASPSRVLATRGGSRQEAEVSREDEQEDRVRLHKIRQLGGFLPHVIPQEPFLHGSTHPSLHRRGL